MSHTHFRVNLNNDPINDFKKEKDYFNKIIVFADLLAFLSWIMIIMNSKKSGDASDKDYIELDSNDDIDKKKFT